MAARRFDDIRRTEKRTGPKTGSGGGAAYGAGYGAGGLGSAQPMPEDSGWDAPGVTPDGRRTGSSTDGPRIATDGESEPRPDRTADDESP